MMVINSRALLPSGRVGNTCARTGCPGDYFDYQLSGSANSRVISFSRFSAVNNILRKEVKLGEQGVPTVLAGQDDRRRIGGCRAGGGSLQNVSSGKWARIGMAVECGGGDRLPILQSSLGFEEPSLREGPSCVFVGPVETAEKDRLEALYQQARDSYYSGQPLIVDDMFDKVEVRLRWYGSKVVLKYPRCSLRRLSAYADAEVDRSQVWALASTWMMLLAGGLMAAAGPPACALSKACRDTLNSRFLAHGLTPTSETVLALNGFLAIGIGLLIGVPVATAAVQALEGLWRGDLVALKGACPSCGEEVYAFVRADESVHPRHKTECHVCEHPLVFHAKVERSASPLSRPWAYGRIYLVTRSKDLAPRNRP